MNSQEQKEQVEFLATFEAALPYLSAIDKTALTQMAATWASREIARREAAANVQGAQA